MDVARISVDGGFIVVEQFDSDYKGVAICFETLEGYRIDLTNVEYKKDTNNIDVYDYEDVWSEEWTRKYSIDINEIKSVIETEY